MTSIPIKPSALTDDDQIAGVQTYGTVTRFWDDGYGPLWVYRCSICVLGVVRARNWEDAFNCVIDEIMDDGDYDDAVRDLTQKQIEDGELNEGYIFRGSGVPSNAGLESSIASEDSNGSDLRQLTDEMADKLHITVFVVAE